MQSVLDVPMGADDVEEACGREWFGEDKIAAGSGRFTVDLARGRDLAHGSQLGKTVLLGERGHVVDDCGLARLDAAVIAIDRLRHIIGYGLGVVDQRSDVLEERLLVAFDGQHLSEAVGTPRPHMESPRPTIAPAVAFWQCIAAAVTIQPSSANRRRGSHAR